MRKKNLTSLPLKKKKTLVVGRLQNILQQMNFTSFSDYYDYVINKITTNSL